MKKLLSIAAISALLVTSANADNTITVTGEVLPSAVVGFVDVSGQTLTSPDFFVDATVDLGTHEVDVFNADALTASNKPIFVKTNIATGHAVTMAITSDQGDNLKDGATAATIPVVYKIGAATLATDGSAPITLAVAANTGSIAIGDAFTITPTAAADQLAGTYGAVLTVAIVAN